MNPENSAIRIPQSEIVFAYTRAQAVADGVQVEITKNAQEAGIRFPKSVFIRVHLWFTRSFRVVRPICG